MCSRSYHSSNVHHAGHKITLPWVKAHIEDPCSELQGSSTVAVQNTLGKATECHKAAFTGKKNTGQADSTGW